VAVQTVLEYTEGLHRLKFQNVAVIKRVTALTDFLARKCMGVSPGLKPEPGRNDEVTVLTM